MILEEETFKKFGYYARDFKPRSWKRIVAACDDCREVHETTKHDYRALCKSCSQKRKPLSEKTKQKISTSLTGLNKGENHYNWKGGLVLSICKICKKKFKVTPSDVRKGGGKYCSRRCMGIASRGKNNPAWKGGSIKRICPICCKSFYARKCIVKKGLGKYCSHSCSAKARIHNSKPQKTKPERIFEEICRNNNLPFHFVGDGTLWLGRANPDFIHDTRKLCVEIYGDYWHSPLLNCGVKYNMTVDGRRKQLKAEGYKLIVLWESDLKRKDAEEFVLYTLKNLKIFLPPQNRRPSL